MLCSSYFCKVSFHKLFLFVRWITVPFMNCTAQNVSLPKYLLIAVYIAVWRKLPDICVEKLCWIPISNETIKMKSKIHFQLLEKQITLSSQDSSRVVFSTKYFSCPWHWIHVCKTFVRYNGSYKNQKFISQTEHIATSILEDSISSAKVDTKTICLAYS